MTKIEQCLSLLFSFDFFIEKLKNFLQQNDAMSLGVKKYWLSSQKWKDSKLWPTFFYFYGLCHYVNSLFYCLFCKSFSKFSLPQGRLTIVFEIWPNMHRTIHKKKKLIILLKLLWKKINDKFKAHFANCKLKFDQISINKSGCFQKKQFRRYSLRKKSQRS